MLFDKIIREMSPIIRYQRSPLMVDLAPIHRAPRRDGSWTARGESLARHEWLGLVHDESGPLGSFPIFMCQNALSGCRTRLPMNGEAQYTLITRLPMNGVCPR